MDKNIALNPNPIVKYLGKHNSQFTKQDIIDYISNNDIEMVNFRYCAGDGRLKTLSFVINDLAYLDQVLTTGERVDGSSIFPFIDADCSDLYVIPRFNTTFVNPFSEIPTVDILCSFFTKDGLPLESAPEHVLRKAHKALKKVTGLDYEVMGELEYYVISEEEEAFEIPDQRGYHESAPFNKTEQFRAEVMQMIAKAGGVIKYGHAEVGNFRVGKTLYEQNEIEFLPTKLEDAADQLLIAKYIIRNLAYQYGLDVTFAPKITAGKAGSGMHVHTRLMKDGKNVVIENGKLTDAAYKAISGYLELAPSISAYGNQNPTSYFRLVPHQEAPTTIVWGDMNRSALVRVPLGWVKNASNMTNIANGLANEEEKDFSIKQTVEFRCPDGSADIYLLLASLAIAARHGFEMENSVQYAKDRYIGVNIHDEKNKDLSSKFNQLPTSCAESANQLDRQRDIYEAYNVFSKGMIDGQIAKLRAFEDTNLRAELEGDCNKMLEYVKTFIHCG
ncbi:MAG: glutamine synthetase [Bacteroidetes bacterium]|nr:glutamine synthetase [Bacteroidota bacterium]